MLGGCQVMRAVARLFIISKSVEQRRVDMKLFRTLIIAGGAYVLGAKAGRERYEQIMDLAQQLWNSRTIRNVGITFIRFAMKL